MTSRYRYIFFIFFFVDHNFMITVQDNQSGCGGNGRLATIYGYVQLAVSMVHRGYAYLKKDTVDYDLQQDVLDDDYKKMIYDCVYPIEKLFDDANKHDNPPAQIHAIISLFRMPIPEVYYKNFSKGLNTLYKICFHENGDFKDAAGIEDIRLVFKDYCCKTPTTWQGIAKISNWRCKNKKKYPLYTKYYALSCTEYNEDLLSMAQSDQLQDLVYLKYLLQKNGSLTSRKIYDYYFTKFFTKEV